MIRGNYLHIRFYFFLLLITASYVFVACTPTEPKIEEAKIQRYAESMHFNSKILNRNVRYSIYLPEKYSKINSYSTVYLLHGYGGNECNWMKDGKIDLLIAPLEKANKVDPMIYIMPQGDNNYNVNRFDGTLNYMRMFTQELVPLIDSLYATKKDRAKRAIVGFSMGGYGALILAAKNPQLFTVSVPLSMSFRTDEQYMNEPQSVFDYQWASIFGAKGTTGDARLTDFFKLHSPFHFFASNEKKLTPTVNYFIDCGDDEETLSETNNALHKLMLQKDIAHEYRMRNGGHNWDYWQSGMREALLYIQSCFDANSYPQETGNSNSEKFSGNLVQLTISETILNVWLPAGYSTSSSMYPVVYFYHSIEANRLAETNKMCAALDSLQKVKPFILVEMNAAEVETRLINMQQISALIDNSYRTKTANTNRIGIGNKLGAKLLLVAANNYSDLMYASFIFDAPLGTEIPKLTAKFMYLSCSDTSLDFDLMNKLYLKCRKEKITHQFRVYNGLPTYNSLLQGMNEAIVSIGLFLSM